MRRRLRRKQLDQAGNPSIRSRVYGTPSQPSRWQQMYATEQAVPTPAHSTPRSNRRAGVWVGVEALAVGPIVARRHRRAESMIACAARSRGTRRIVRVVSQPTPVLFRVPPFRPLETVREHDLLLAVVIDLECVGPAVGASEHLATGRECDHDTIFTGCRIAGAPVRTFEALVVDGSRVFARYIETESVHHTPPRISAAAKT